MIRIAVEENIPLLARWFADDVAITFFSSQAIANRQFQDADALVIRSTQRVDAELLAASRIRFVASPVSGKDHLDTDSLQRAGIAWYHAPGCNATAVVQYVLSVLACCRPTLLSAAPKIAILGVGQVGSRLLTALSALGLTPILCDPFRADEPGFIHHELRELRGCDIVSLHTPLTSNGPHPTRAMISREWLRQQNPGALIINAARGDLLRDETILDLATHCDFALDVFPHEPDINLDVLHTAKLATPHIAGHSHEAKLRGAFWVAKAIIAHFNCDDSAASAPELADDALLPPQNDWVKWCLRSYDPRIDHKALQNIDSQHVAAEFTKLRKTYRQRSEKPADQQA